MIYPLVMTNIAMENHHAIKNGKSTISMAIFNRVEHPTDPDGW